MALAALALALATLGSAAAAAASGGGRGRGQDCGPCDRSPWVPVARALRAHQFALAIPTIQLTLPVAQVRPPPISPSESVRGSAPPSRGQFGAPLLDDSQFGLPPPPLPQRFATPFKTYGPQAQYDSASNPTEQKNILHPQQAQTNVGAHTNANHPDQKHLASNVRNSQAKDQLSSTSNDNPTESKPIPPIPKPQSQIKSESNPPQDNKHPQNYQFAPPIGLRSNPTEQKYFPSPNYPLLPSVKFGPPFDTKSPPSYNPFLKPHSLLPSSPPPHHGARPVYRGPQQHQESIKRPIFIEGLRPIAFPTASKTQLPPLFGYQQFNSGQNDQPRPYLEPPKPQNVVFTIVESDDVCKKCHENGHKTQKGAQTDSDTAQAEHVTESIHHTTLSAESNLEEHKTPIGQKQSVQTFKSVPLAEYLASVEYPMQIVQAPILDVPDLTKYFNLGYSLPQKHHSHNYYNLNDQHPSPTFVHPNKQNSAFESQGLRGKFTEFEHTSQAALDNVELLDSDTRTTDQLPHNHKINHDLEKDHISTEKTTSYSPFSQPSSYATIFSTRPSQIFHISKASPSTAHTTALPASSEFSTTTSHYVTSQSLDESITEQQLPNPANPAPFNEPLKPALEDQSAGTAKDSNPSDSSHLRFINPPPLGSGAISDWSLPTFGRGWGNLPPKPFTVPASNYRPRFSARPSPVPAKKAKHIHQIIIPYTTNKQAPISVQEPTNHLGWTPVPPTNRGRKVPSNVGFENQFPSNTGSDNTPSGGYNASKQTLATDSAKNTEVDSTGASWQHILSGKGQPLDLPPHVINQILQYNKQGTSGSEPTSWPSGPDELQQLLVTNLQGLLRGEEDSIDFNRLQKNIDNWTAEGYKQNSPPVHFVPVTTTSHIFNSKKIPDEYLTTEPTTLDSTSQDSVPRNHQHFYSDHEGAASQRHQVNIPPTNFEEESEIQDTTDDIEALLDTKVTTIPPTSSSTEAWEKTRVSISPLTKEKVYVVTPEPVSEVNSTPSSQD